MAIRWEKLTVKAQEAVQRGNDLASEHGNPELLPLHLLAGTARRQRRHHSARAGENRYWSASGVERDVS